MGIDRKLVKARLGQTPLADRVVRGIDDLVRICRAAATAGELLALEPRLDRFTERRSKAARARAKDGRPFKASRLMKTDQEARALCLISAAMHAAESLPSDAPVDEQFWESAQSGVDAENSET